MTYQPLIRPFSLAVAAFSLLMFAIPVTAAPRADRTVILISVDGLAGRYLNDPKANMPTIRRLMQEGAVCEAMTCSFPTVTWPNHTTLVTGVHPAKHGVIGNSYWERSTNGVVPLLPDPLFDKEEIVKVPTVYDVAFDAGLKTAGVIWPASRNAKKLTWQMPDMFPNALFQKYSTPSLLTELKAAGIPYEMQEEWCKTGKGEDRDKMYAATAAHIIAKHQPNVLVLHLVEVDHVEHAKGPQTPEAYEAVAFADARVKQVFDSIAAGGLQGRATFIVSSDHGFAPYQQQIQPNVLLKKEGLLKLEGTKMVGLQARALAQGGSCFIYVLNQANRADILKQLAARFKEVEGVESVIQEKDFAKHGLASPTKNPQMADLVLSAKAGYSFSDTANGEIIVTPKTEAVKGTHGHDPSNPLLYGSFVAWGAGIKPGTKIKAMNNTDVAPTMARLLGLEMKNVDGRVLTEILAK